jgi:hypothetical protein
MDASYQTITEYQAALPAAQTQAAGGYKTLNKIQRQVLK